MAGEDLLEMITSSPTTDSVPSDPRSSRKWSNGPQRRKNVVKLAIGVDELEAKSCGTTTEGEGFV